MEEKEEENYYYIQSTIEDIFRNQDVGRDVYLYENIPDSFKTSFNKSLGYDFAENIEYLLFYDDSLDNSGTEVIAMVKKEENYFIAFQQHWKQPVIFFLYSQYEEWEINRMSIDEYDYALTISTDLDAKVLNGDDFYKLDETADIKFERKRFYVFNFYNLKFLKLFVELCEQINDELD